MTPLLAASVLALAAAATPTPAPTAATSGPWVVVQKDGARVSFGAPPQLRNGRWVGRLRGSGALVSVPASRVDAAATARANAPGAREPQPAPRATPTPRPFETPPLGDVAKLRTSAEEASRLLEGARKGTPAPRPSLSAGPDGGMPEPPVEDAPRDRRGRGEEWWRARAGSVRDAIEEASRRVAEAEARLEAAERDYLGPSEGERNSWVLRVQAERDFVEAARREHQRASAAWDELQEEARKAGAFPGWLR